MYDRAATALAVLAAAALALASCGADGETSSSPSTTRRATTTTEAATTSTTKAGGSGASGCPTAAEVGEVLGTTVDKGSNGGGESSMGGTSYSYTGCSYHDEAEGVAAIVRLTTEDDVDSLFDALDAEAQEAGLTDGFEALDREGLGKEAYRDGTEVATLTDKAIVLAGVDLADGTPTDEITASTDLAVAAVAADPGPTDPDCDALEATVAGVAGPVTSTSSGGGSIVVDEVTLTTRGCYFELEDGSSASITVAAPDQWAPWVAASKASGFTASYEATTVGEHTAFDTGDALVVDDGEQPLRVTAVGFETDDPAALRAELAALAVGG